MTAAAVLDAYLAAKAPDPSRCDQCGASVCYVAGPGDFRATCCSVCDSGLLDYLLSDDSEPYLDEIPMAVVTAVVDDLLDDTDPADHFTVETTERPWTMTLTCTDCAGTVTFWDPTDDRQQWYRGSHRCGGFGWQEAS